MANPTLANVTENNIEVRAEMFQELTVNLCPHLSEVNIEGYICNKLPEVKDTQHNH